LGFHSNTVAVARCLLLIVNMDYRIRGFSFEENCKTLVKTVTKLFSLYWFLDH